MVAELASASSRMKFRQLLLGDADEARNQLKRLVSKTVMVTQASMVSHPKVSLRLEVVAVKAYDKLVLVPIYTDRRITVANGPVDEVIWCV